MGQSVNKSRAIVSAKGAEKVSLSKADRLVLECLCEGWTHGDIVRHLRQAGMSRSDARALWSKAKGFFDRAVPQLARNISRSWTVQECIDGVSHDTGLPKVVVRRMVNAAREVLREQAFGLRREDVQAESIAFYREIAGDTNAKAEARIKARERLDAMLGVGPVENLEEEKGTVTLSPAQRKAAIEAIILESRRIAEESGNEGSAAPGEGDKDTSQGNNGAGASSG